MAITPTIVSPGVELREIDNSIRASVPSGTTIFVPIFAQQGPTGEVLSVSSLDEFVTIFGLPTTPAEKAGYVTVSQLFQSSANIQVSRLPYGAGDGDTTSPQYTILAYPALGFAFNQDAVREVADTNAKRQAATALYAQKEGDLYQLVDTDTLAQLQRDYYKRDNDAGTYSIITNYADSELAGATISLDENGTNIISEDLRDIILAAYYTVVSTTNSFVPVKQYSGGSTGIDGKYEDSVTFLIGEPVQFNISLEQYYKFLNGQALDDSSSEFVWSDAIPDTVPTTLADLGKFAFITLNIGKTVINDNYEGFYLALTDNAFSDPGTTYAGIRNLKTVTKLKDTEEGITGLDYTTVPTERLDFKLSSSAKGCISQIMQESLNSFDISASQWNDTLNFGLFKVRQATNTGDALKLAAVVFEGYNASLEYDRKTTSKYSTGAVDFFVENISKNQSTNLNIYVNPHLSGAITSRGLYTDGTPKVKVRVYARQLGNATSAISEEQLKLTPEEIMAIPSGISKAAFDSIASTHPSFKFADALYPVGLYAKSDNASKIIGNVPSKLQSALRLIENEEIYNIDILVEGGLGTIYATSQDYAMSKYNEELAKIEDTKEQDEFKAKYPYGYMPEHTLYDDTRILKGVTDMRTSKTSLSSDAEQVIANFRAVQNMFLSLATTQQEGGRGDIFFVGDTLRQISVEGKDNKVEKMFGMPLTNAVYSSTDQVVHSFSTSIYWPMRHLFEGVATSFMAVYPYYLKVQDITNGTQIWAPTSGAVAAKMAAADATYGPWQAAAGTNNGILSGVLDISYTTNQRQRDDMYKISLNPIISSPSSGITLWGCRTFIKKESAFDQIPCRRTFLYINKILRDTSKQFLFEGNTEYTRLQVETILNPVFQAIVDARGLYSYVLICDNRNNTSDVIDEGFMRIDFYGSPTRVAERILITSVASRSGNITTEFDS